MIKHIKRLFVVVCAGTLFGSAGVNAAELRVLAAAALNPVTTELFATFERTTGHKLTVRSSTGPILNKEIDEGAAFDVVILSLDVEGLIRKGKVAAGSRVALVRTGVGVGVRKGLPRPDIATVESFRRSLLATNSVAYSRQGSSGLYFLSLLDRLGIAADMQQKLRPQDGDNPADALPKGDADMTVLGIALILLQPGADFVGPVPDELQNYVLFTGGVSAASQQPEAARALLQALTSPSAQAAFKAKGFDPVAQ